ncbi:MAG: BsuPI-related putative proteinase inhibitor, partial [Gemmatimonadaceae bacterium]
QDPVIPKQRDEILLRLTLSSATIRPGEPDTIRVTAANNFGERITIQFPNACIVFAYIRDPRGRVVTPGRGWSCIPVVSTLVLNVNEVRTFTFVWTGLSEFAGTLQPTPLVPGDYYATATLQSGDFAVHTPPVRVTLLP